MRPTDRLQLTCAFLFRGMCARHTVAGARRGKTATC
eukprot:CAMPEP_0115721072 /NCGR_PEP_ID=MMETSP0272-20121206/78889_1 /TAXON_ID=71861 /ORGANISM="Scrippsiella trochoidea, Strain CCMP3099" /LENGTH=35 /DNA_ID= /DNA_START= /DNA_END= /DNA_ORIENTATION=